VRTALWWPEIIYSFSHRSWFQLTKHHSKSWHCPVSSFAILFPFLFSIFVSFFSFLFLSLFSFSFPSCVLPFPFLFLASFSFILVSCLISSQFSSFSPPSCVVYFFLYHIILALFSFISLFVILLFFSSFVDKLFSATSRIREGWENVVLKRHIVPCIVY